MERKLIIAGLGGQGVVLLTRLLSEAAVADGHAVLASETHGMSQRGGSVLSHLKIGGSEAPLIQRGTADILIAMEPNEAIRNLAFLRREGNVFVNADGGFEAEVRAHLDRLNILALTFPANHVASELGVPAVANVVLAGFAIAAPILPLSYKTVQQTLRKIVPRSHEINLRALEMGYKMGVESITNVIEG